ncbi:MAG: hypothetical protein WAU68_06650 [Vitreimonas sp.]
MPRVLGNNHDPRIPAQPAGFPRAVIAYAVLCFVAAVFVIASTFLPS